MHWKMTFKLLILIKPSMPPALAPAYISRCTPCLSSHNECYSIIHTYICNPSSFPSPSIPSLFLSSDVLFLLLEILFPLFSAQPTHHTLFWSQLKVSFLRKPSLPFLSWVSCPALGLHCSLGFSYDNTAHAVFISIDSGLAYLLH